MAPIAQQLPLQAYSTRCQGRLWAALQSTLNFTPAVSSGLQNGLLASPGAQNSQIRQAGCPAIGAWPVEVSGCRPVVIRQVQTICGKAAHQYCGMCWLRVVLRKLVPFTFLLHSAQQQSCCDQCCS